jgi:hypothetical protein
VDSFKQQFAGIDSTTLKQVKVQGPIGEFYTYLANPITVIQCKDKKGNYHELKNKPSIEIRFTHGINNRRSIFYFDRVILQDNTIIGIPSKFISSLKKTIQLDEVTKIEVQDGRKRFTYVNQ